MTVQFKSPATSGNIEGLLEIDVDFLTVEFEQARFLRKDRVVRLKIPLDDLDYVRYTGLPFRARLEIRALYLPTLQKLPWAKSLTAHFVIPRTERERARELAYQFDEFIHEEVGEQPHS